MLSDLIILDILNECKELCSFSGCTRRQYGAIIYDPNTRKIISSGTNRSPKGIPNCTEENEVCDRIRLNIPHGTSYEICRAVHAEQAAIIQAQTNLTGKYLFLYGMEDKKPIKSFPCKICARMIKESGISKIIGSLGSEGSYYVMNAEDLEII